LRDVSALSKFREKLFTPTITLLPEFSFPRLTRKLSHEPSLS
jgi:hypothetical protein